jgi:hypothetical protein
MMSRLVYPQGGGHGRSDGVSCIGSTFLRIEDGTVDV